MAEKKGRPENGTPAGAGRGGALRVAGHNSQKNDAPESS